MAKKSAARKATMKKPAKKAAHRPMARRPKPAGKARPASTANGRRTAWFDADHKPLISEYAHRLQPFIDTMADGEVDERELQAQEKRLIASMKDVESQLAGPLHGKVTRLLCEMAAYDLMQTVHALQGSRPKSVFRG